MRSLLPLLLSCLLASAALQAQEASPSASTSMPIISSVQGDVLMFYADFGNAELIVSSSVAMDVDCLEVSRYSNSVYTLGLHIGYESVNWPGLFKEDIQGDIHGYHADDVDLLCRYTFRSEYVKLDVFAGPTLRFGQYRSENTLSFLEDQYEKKTSLGLKLGSFWTFMIGSPALGLRFGGSASFFGKKPVEAAKLGFGIVIGWQRGVND